MTPVRSVVSLLSVALIAGCDAPAAAVAGMPSPRFEGGGCIDLAPSVTIDQASDQPDPVRSQPIRFVVVFSEPVSGFEASDVLLERVTNGTRLPVKGATVSVSPVDARTYHVAVSGLKRPGVITASVVGNAATAQTPCASLSAASTSTDNDVFFLGRRSE